MVSNALLQHDQVMQPGLISHLNKSMQGAIATSMLDWGFMGMNIDL